MNKLILKTATGIATVGLLIATMAPAVFADLEISGNGYKSDNTIKVTNTSNCTVTQKNTTNVTTEAVVVANTGGNSASMNTGGDASVDTGDATAKVDVSVGGGSNEAVDPCCGCPDQAVPPATLISGNGALTDNDVIVKDTSNKDVYQKNKTNVYTGALVVSNTGKNKSNKNTGGTASVTTGKSKAKVRVVVDPSSNSL